jgi:uncharacterized protein (DUF924 family)
VGGCRVNPSNPEAMPQRCATRTFAFPRTPRPTLTHFVNIHHTVSTSTMKPYNITSAIHKASSSYLPLSMLEADTDRSQILGFQSIFKSSVPFTSFRQMSSITAMDPNITRINSYWFETDDHMQKWFRGGPQVDAEIRSQFSELISQARASKLTSWTERPEGTLALLILLDQFPRNIFRGTQDAFSSDAMALDVAVTGIAKGQHKQLKPLQQLLFHMPFTHDERLISQVTCVALCEAMAARCEGDVDISKFAQASVDSAKGHLNVILRFGRFPGRNAALGRESTAEEIEFLKENPFGV